MDDHTLPCGVCIPEVDEYRLWCRKHFRESPGFALADAAIAALEALVAKYERERDRLA